MIILKKSILIGILSLSVLFSGCSNRSSTPQTSPQPTYTTNQMEMDTNAKFDGEMSKELGQGVSSYANSEMVGVSASARKVITTLGYYIQTKDYSKTIDTLNTLIAETKSFVQQSNTGGDEINGDAYADYVIRVPVDVLDSFKNDVKKLGNITNITQGGEDVTAQFFDTEARLTVLTAQEKRVLQLLDKAETIEDIMLIENELSRIRTEIEQLTTVIKRLEDLTSYATVNLNMSQTKDYTVTHVGFFGKVSAVFGDSLKGFVNVLASLGTLLIWLLPYLIIGSIILIVFLRLYKKHKSKAIIKKDVTLHDSENDTEIKS